jgi:hypothetical protein
MRRLSCRSVPMTCSPPISSTSRTSRCGAAGTAPWRRAPPSSSSAAHLDPLGSIQRVLAPPSAQQRELELRRVHLLRLALLDPELARRDLAEHVRADLVVGHLNVEPSGCDAAPQPVVEQLLARELAELDVGAAAGHVRRDHHRAELAGVLDDVRLALVLLGVEHLVLDLVLPSQHRAEHLALLDAGRAHEHGTPASWNALISSTIASHLSF